MIRFPRREVKTKNLGGNGGILIDTDICQPSVLENVENLQKEKMESYPLYKNRPIQREGPSLLYPLWKKEYKAL